MHNTIASLLAPALLAAAVMAHAQDLAQPSAEAADSATVEDDGQAPAVTPQPDLDFAPMTRSERLRDYLNGTFGTHRLADVALRAELGQLTRNPKELGR